MVRRTSIILQANNGYLHHAIQLIQRIVNVNDRVVLLFLKSIREATKRLARRRLARTRLGHRRLGRCHGCFERSLPLLLTGPRCGSSSSHSRALRLTGTWGRRKTWYGDLSLCCCGYISGVYAPKTYGETYFSLVFLSECAPVDQCSEKGLFGKTRENDGVQEREEIFGSVIVYDETYRRALNVGIRSS